MEIRLVIFDVDGTVYDQKRLRIKMLIELAIFILRNPLGIRKVRILSAFRKLIEKSRKLDQTGYYNKHLQFLSEKYGVPVVTIHEFIEEWMQKRPLKYLINHGEKQIFQTLNYLETNNIQWTFYSDYFPDDKLNAMGIRYSSTYFSSMDRINCLKPDPKSVNIILEDFQVKPCECVVIGDRDSVDGKLAINAETHFILFKAPGKKDFLVSAMKSLVEKNPPSAATLQYINS